MIDLSDLNFGSLIYVGIFLGILLAFDGIWQLISRAERPNDARNRRMRLIASGASTGEILNLLKPQEAHWSLDKFPFLGTLPRDIRLAGLTIRPSTVLGFGVFVMLVAGVLLAVRMSPVIAFAISALIGLVLPSIIIRKMGEARMKKLVNQLPDALDLMARGLRVGHPLNATIATIGRDMVDPIATEFGVIVDQVSYGDDIVGAFRDFADRVKLEDVNYLATGIAIQNGTGGDLSKILATLAKVIRARIAMRKRILAISSEGRLTAVFMSLLPVFIYGSTSLTSPNYYADVSGDPLYKPIASIVVFLIVANYLAMRRLVNFRI